MVWILFLLYFWLIEIPVFGVYTILTAVSVMIGCMLGGQKFFAYYPGMLWSRIACNLTFCPVKVRGREHLEKGQSYVFVANHQGAFDIFMIYGYLGIPIKWMMKMGLGKIPFVGNACRAAGFIFVDQSSPRKASRSIAEAERQLKNGYSLAVFPEGSRTPSGKVGRFHKGAYQIAWNRRLSIVPITLNGSYNVLPIGSACPHPHRMEMVIHPPIRIDEALISQKDGLQSLISRSREIIVSDLWEEYK